MQFFFKKNPATSPGYILIRRIEFKIHAPVARVIKIQVSSVHTEQPDTPGFAALLS